MVQFRKSKQAGLFRVTATKKGLGMSVGKGPLRVSVSADGTVRRTISAPGTGVYDTRVVGKLGRVQKDTHDPEPEVARPGRRLTPARLEPPIRVESSGSVITFDGRTISIEHSGLRAKVNSLRAVEYRVEEICGWEWVAPSLTMKGFLRLVVAGQNPGPTKPSVATQDPNAVLVGPKQKTAIIELIEALESTQG